MTPSIGTAWDQQCFLAFQESLSQQRRQLDEFLLRRLLQRSSEYSLLARLLEWGDKHGVRYMIDRKCPENMAYYIPGTGVVALTQHAIQAIDAPAMLGHEVRHAWQDYYGLLHTMGKNFSSFFIRAALVEADAFAFQSVSERDSRFATRTGSLSFITRPDNEIDLAGYFRDWFSLSVRAGWYGRRYLSAAMNQNGLAAPEDISARFEFLSECEARYGLFLENLDDVTRLGKVPGGGNYMKRVGHDFLLKTALSPSLATTFYGHASRQERADAEVQRKAALKGSLKR